MPTTTLANDLAEAQLPGFDAVEAAFDLFAAGDDDGSLAVLAAIGLTSRLLPWKLMLRGLIAWRGRDDGRARDNWCRLPADSVPARLVAPLRAEIDLDFRRARAESELAKLRRQYKALVGGRLSASLKKLHDQFVRRPPEQTIARARPLLEPLKKMVPTGPDRLTAALSRLLCEQGHPRDLAVFTLHFPPPADDPRFDRLYALVAEGADQLSRAAGAWRDYDALLVERPAIFGTDTDRARAHIWHRIASLEWDVARAERGNKSSEKPDPKASVRQALELAPDYWPALRLQFEMAEASGRVASILKTGRALLQHHPNCDDTLVTLAGACRAKGKRDESLEFSRRLYEHAPLDPDYCNLFASDLRMLARRQLRFDDLTGLALLDRVVELNPDVAVSVHAIRAAHASRAGKNDVAEHHIREAGRHPAETALRMLAEAEFFDVPKLTKRFMPRVQKALAGPSTVLVCVALTDALADQFFDHVTFAEQKEIEKKVQAKVIIAGKKARGADLPALFAAVRRAGWAHPLARLFYDIEHKHAKDPRLPFEVAIALLAEGPDYREKAGAHARKALKRLQALPVEQRPPGIADELEELFGPLLHQRDPFEDLFGGFPFGGVP